jgi:hypothetical protein
MLNCVVLFSRILMLMILPLDSIMTSKRKCKPDKEATKICKVMALDEKINIPDKLRGGISEAAFGR